jgi:nucleoside 2-deoxyribosyltransferase
MQPFGGTLGGYYDSIFRPAIERIGLMPIRADAEIFSTGKIMDQVWRGIRSAKVLVAELTSKNPNVFYELGLAHALNKPVVLVSSNEDDVPFDLRHIRVIVYDRLDPFWGQKLIDKVADNIESALTNPEEAIFRVDESAS